MRHDIYQTPPAPAKALVDEIEGCTGFEVQLLPTSVRDLGRWLVDIGDQHAGAVTNWDLVIIEYPDDLRDATENDFIDEILCLHRPFVEQVPHLYPKRKEHSASAAGLENCLEHTFIYQRQRAICRDFQTESDAEPEQFWRRCRWRSSTAGLAAVRG